MAGLIVTAVIGILIVLVIKRLFSSSTAPPLRSVEHPPRPETLPNYDERKQHFTTDPDGELQVVYAKTGSASLPAKRVMDFFDAAVKRHGDTVALKVERPAHNQWKTWTWKQYRDDIHTAAKAMIHLGMKPFESVNILGFNSPEWFIGNLAAIWAGGKAAGIYSTNAPPLCQYISDHSDARVVLLDNEKSLAKYLEIRDALPKLAAIVIWEGSVPEGVNVEGKCPVYSWEEFMALGKDPDGKLEEELQKRMAAQKPGHCCTLIYTSGTTGMPKAVMISHDNLTWTTANTAHMIPELRTGRAMRVVSYLPLSHVAGQMLDIYLPMWAAGHTDSTTEVWFARPDALKGSLKTTLLAARPTAFFGVPRVWEKFADALQEAAAQTKGFKKTLSTWAKAQAAAAHAASQVGGSGKIPAMYPVAKKILGKVRAALGLDHCNIFLTSAAPISPATLNYFGSLDIHIQEVFGMSECTGPHTTSCTNYFQVGSIGFQQEGVETRLDHDPKRDRPGEGEICFRGRHIMMGYMKSPDKTREAIDPDGFLHSGDTGNVDEKTGLYKITGRIKELIITAGGENIAPVPVEDNLKDALPAIANCIMIGDRRKFNIVLVTLHSELDEKTGLPTNRLTGPSLKISSARTVEEAREDPVWKEYITKGIKTANSKAVSNAAKLQYFDIVPDFSIAGGELTPTMKLKRAAVTEKHKEVIDKFYPAE